jgi:hypothetical protein
MNGMSKDIIAIDMSELFVDFLQSHIPHLFKIKNNMNVEDMTDKELP